MMLNEASCLWVGCRRGNEPTATFESNQMGFEKGTAGPHDNAIVFKNSSSLRSVGL